MSKNIRHDFVTPEFIDEQNQVKISAFTKVLNNNYDEYEKHYICYDYGNSLKSDGTRYITLEQKRKDTDESIRLFKESLGNLLDVRVIERIKDGVSLFYLLYGDADDNSESGGTGSFQTLEDAKEWFIGGGR